MSTSTIAASTAPRATREALPSSDSLSSGSAKLDAPQFSQVMNLVQPKVAQEAVRAYEAHAEPKAREAKPADDRADEVRDVKESAAQPAYAQAERVSADRKLSGDQASEGLAALEDTSKRVKLLHLISQLSSEDLINVAQWNGDLGLQAGALDTHLSLQHLPKVEGISTSDMMALLNGFKELKLNTQQLPALDGPQLAQWLESQWASARAQTAQPLHLSNAQFAAEANPQQAFNVNPAAMAAMTPVARPAEVMPALEMLRLSQSQKEGILRQVAQGFKSQRGGTQSVNIRLHPEELGAVRLKVEVQGQEVRLFFSAESAAVNDLISQNLDELRAMLLEKEFNLAEAGVFQEQLNQGEQQSSEDEGEDYGSDERPDLKHRPKSQPKLSPLPSRFRATV